MKLGFTIIEVLIAVVVITVGILGVLAVIHQTISYMSLSSSKLIATYLTQEGMEIVRNIRDTNWLEGENWNSGLEEGDYEADYNDLSLSPFQDNRFLKIDPAGFYNYDAGNQTKFKRKITISNPRQACGQNPCLSVKVEVFWQQLGKEQRVTVEEYLYNWIGE